MAVRESKRALQRAAQLLGTDDRRAREYLRRIQAGVGEPVPYAEIVAAIEQVGRDEDAVLARVEKRA